MIPPKGYVSTAVWAAFLKWAEKNHLPDDDMEIWTLEWAAFRDGYSAGLAEQDV